MSDELKSNISGYGLVFKNVFKDENLDIEALALYAYLSAYAGQDNISFPGVGLICKDLKISERRYKKYRKQLEDNGYLKVERKRKDSGFSNNIYTIYHSPVSLQNVPLQNVPLQFVPLQNVGTTINSITNNSITNNSNTRESERKQDELKNKNLINHFQQKITQLNPRNMEELLSWKDDFNSKGQGYEIVEYAIEVSEQANAYSFGYLKKKLKGYSDAKVTTLEQAQGYENKGNKKTSKRQTGNLIKQKMEEAKASEYDKDTGA